MLRALLNRAKSSHGMRAHLFRSMLLLTLAVLCASFLVSALMIYGVFFNQTSDSFQRSCTQFNRMLELRFSELSKCISILANDAAVQKLYTANYSDDYDRYLVQQDVDKLLSNLFSRSNQLDVCLLLEQESRIYTNLQPDSTTLPGRPRFNFQSCAVDLAAIRALPWYAAGNAPPIRGFSYVHAFELPGFHSAAGLALLQRFQYTGKQMGHLILLMGNEWMEPLFETEHTSETYIILGQSGGELYATGERSGALMAQADQILAYARPAVLSLDGERYIVHHQPSDLYGLHIIAAQSLSPLLGTLGRTICIYLLAGVALAGVTIWISARQSRKLTGPLTAITREIDTAPVTFQIVPGSGSTREIHMLASCLNQMSLRINLLVENMLDTHLMQKNAEIYALKQQVNPHFLYNTIETINSMAIIKDCGEISSVASHLGSMLRYALETDLGVVPLKRELNHLEDYLAINHIRGLAFEIHVNIDPSLMDTPVPRLILQPLVENSFKHGFRGTQRPWLLEVTAERHAKNFTLRIRDNGVGMTGERLEKVRRSLHYNRNDSESIGMYNVHRRIHLLYGEAYGIVLDSAPGQGTCIALTLPLFAQEPSHA